MLNFHSSDLCYYEEWFEDVADEGGWIAFVNTLRHVESEMLDNRIQSFASLGGPFSELNWRGQKPDFLVRQIDEMQDKSVSLLH